MLNSIERISKCTFMNQLFNVQYIFDFFFKFGLFSPPKLVSRNYKLRGNGLEKNTSKIKTENFLLRRNWESVQRSMITHIPK